MRLVTCASRWPRPVWLGQLGRFAIVGLAATLTHVAVALSPLQANLAGFIVAVALSFQGHLRVTFQVKAPQQYHLYRFVVLSLASLAISSLITAVGTRNGGDMRLVMAFVALIVPVASFFIARLWAFAIPGVTVPAPQ